MTKAAREVYEKWSETAESGDLWAAFCAGFEARQKEEDEEEWVKVRGPKR